MREGCIYDESGNKFHLTPLLWGFELRLVELADGRSSSVQIRMPVSNLAQIVPVASSDNHL